MLWNKVTCVIYLYDKREEESYGTRISMEYIARCSLNNNVQNKDDPSFQYW